MGSCKKNTNTLAEGRSCRGPWYREEREMLKMSESGGTRGEFSTRDGARGYWDRKR